MQPWRSVVELCVCCLNKLFALLYFFTTFSFWGAPSERETSGQFTGIFGPFASITRLLSDEWKENVEKQKKMKVCRSHFCRASFILISYGWYYCSISKLHRSACLSSDLRWQESFWYDFWIIKSFFLLSLSGCLILYDNNLYLHWPPWIVIAARSVFVFLN